eukprot:GFYU01003069.1.p1 GENE.GFYU01003069.1~~GFYU01003069.1.p1  ORF type:complete len:555 (-),score=126.15 GFYU01003069.1:135-1676(-)
MSTTAENENTNPGGRGVGSGGAGDSVGGDVTSDVSETHTHQITILSAIQRGDSELLHTFLDSGIDVNQEDDKGITLLSVAVLSLNVEAVRTLLAHGADASVNTADEDGITPLHYAACHCFDEDVEIVEMLVAHGADLCATNVDAIYYVSSVPIYQVGGRTPLHFAVSHHNWTAVQCLVQAGSDIAALDFDGLAAVDYLTDKPPRDLHTNPEVQSVAEALIPSGYTVKSVEDIKHLRESDKCKHRWEAARQWSKNMGRIRALKKQQRAIEKNYKRLHASVYTYSRDHFHPVLEREGVWDAIDKQDINALRSALHRIGDHSTIDGVFIFPVFSQDTCRLLLEELSHFEECAKSNASLPLRRPNSMNNYGVVVNEIGLQSHLDDLLRDFLRPIARALYCDDPAVTAFTETLDHHHSFSVKYKVNEDLKLDQHMDDSEITLNVCLGKSFEEGKLYFRGVKDVQKEKTMYAHQIGHGCIHLGAMVHGAEHITSGERHNLIVWAKSSLYRNQQRALMSQ